ncbi:TlpA family protein disulfide reductase [Stenotrophomonas sp. SAM-B]|uniref:peroxiredoxin family protein n=1 Tax=Stenotrophomonas sp. SAM-B TaxID=2729141 RepID=UPI0015A11CBB|nr:TlpA disulfide reductase family protein [Stenotrophomonas sp. SAM-B]NWF32398.1 TlpA family protein disulfide reductase [Stenotrophomonas sp. SAM-B]
MDASALRKYGPLALIVVLAALMTTLAVQNRQLRQQQAVLVSKVEQISKAVHGLPEGARPEAFDATALDGQALTLAGPASGRQILYFFSPACRFCLASVPQIQALDAAGRNNGNRAFEMVGVSLPPHETAADYARQHGFDFPVVNDTDDRITQRYSATMVPMVVVIQDGKVIYRYVGQLKDSSVNAITGAFVVNAARSAMPPPPAG